MSTLFQKLAADFQTLFSHRLEHVTIIDLTFLPELLFVIKKDLLHELDGICELLLFVRKENKLQDP